MSVYMCMVLRWPLVCICVYIWIHIETETYLYGIVKKLILQNIYQFIEFDPHILNTISVMVIIRGNGIGDLSSNPRQSWLCFILC